MDAVYAVVCRENHEDWFWFWFLTVLHECLGGLKRVIMSNRHKLIEWAIPRVFGVENHCYCVIHVGENFVAYASKLGIRRNAPKDLVKEMFNRMAYAAIVVEYGQVMEELCQYKHELAQWVEDNELER